MERTLQKWVLETLVKIAEAHGLKAVNKEWFVEVYVPFRYGKEVRTAVNLRELKEVLRKP